MSRIQVIIPIYHPTAKFHACLRALAEQTPRDFSVLILDSGSEEDIWRHEAEQLHAEVIRIDPTQFNHGGTRQQGIEHTRAAEIHVFLTQDAVPADAHAIVHLVQAFDDPQVGCAYGRQLPHPEADLFAAHARAFNYPAHGHCYTFADRVQHGMKTAFCSNSFAAYRREAMEAVDGFPVHTILSEDMYVTARMLQAGWKAAYVADACVYHSHNYSLCQEFRRYFDIGVFHHREKWIRDTFGQAEDEGGRFVRDEVHLLLRRAPHLLPLMVIRDGLKFLGYRLGIAEDYMPRWLKRRFLSMNPHFFNGG